MQRIAGKFSQYKKLITLFKTESNGNFLEIKYFLQFQFAIVFTFSTMESQKHFCPILLRKVIVNTNQGYPGSVEIFCITTSTTQEILYH